MIDRLLTRLSQLLKTDLHYLLTGGFFLALIQISSALVGLLLTVAFANLLPVDAYGTYKYVLSVYSLIAIAAMPGIDTAVTQSVSRGFDQSFFSGIKTKVRWGLMTSAILFGIAGYNFLNGHVVIAGIFAIMGFAAPLMESSSVLLSYLNGKKEFRRWAYIEIITQVASALFLIGTMVMTKNILFTVAAYFLPYIFVRWTIIVLERRRISHGNEDAGLDRYGRSLTLFQIISRGISSIDQIVIYHVLGPAQVAIFSLALALPTRIQSMFKIVSTLAMPRFAKRDAREVAQSLPRKLFLFSLGIACISLVYILAAPYLFTYLFPKYIPSLPYTKVLIFYTLSAATYPFGSLLFAHKKIKESYIISLSSIIVKIISLSIFVPIVGIWGAVVSVLGASATVVVITIFLLIREIRSVPTGAQPSL